MAGVNKVILVGNLGRDPEIRYTPSGVAVANFSIATTETWTNKDGGKETRTEWHRIVAFGKLGEICGQYLSKGKQVYIEGRIQTEEWEDKEKVKRQTTKIIARDMQMLGARGPGEMGDTPLESRGGGDTQDPSGPGSDNDIPF